MLNKIIKDSIPDDVLYEIFKQFISEKKMSDISSVNKEWSDLVKGRLMIMHLKKIILNIQEDKHKLEVDNQLLTRDNIHINWLYDDLIDTVETFMDLNEM
tara:strand:- start:255 stop:554 length:300 start_codon:yes stop_codon:yes gene_type:complete